MPMMIPPGQGTTVTLSGPQAQAVMPAAQGPGPAPQARLTAPPSPFRQAHGPDVLIMPHTEEQPQQPQQQFRRPGALLQLARRVLKLALSRRDVEPFTKSFAANPGDDAPHLVFADYLDEAGDPRAAIVRQQVSRGRQTYGRPWFISPPESFDSTGGGYDFRRYVAGGTRGDGGWMALVPHKEKPQVMAIWRPDASSENHESSIYRAVFSPDHAHEIARHVGLDSYVAAKFPDHAKPKIITDPN